MSDLRIEVVDGDAMLEQWRHVHNVIVPPAAMTLDEVRERVTRGYRLENAYAGDVLVGCSTVRPPQGEDAVLPGESELWLTLRLAPFPSWTGGTGGAVQRFSQSCGNSMCAASRSS